MRTNQADPPDQEGSGPQASQLEDGKVEPIPAKRSCLTEIVDLPEWPPIVSHRHT